MALDRRSIKKAVNDCLALPDLESSRQCVRKLPAGKATKPLLAALCSADDDLKWRAVSLIGLVIALLAEEDMEAARTMMRRLMWSLNDESGGIGWGAPESMAEAMVEREELASEFANILISFIAPEGQYLEHVPLQRGAVWGVGRLARFRPAHLADAEQYLVPLLGAEDLQVRALAAWALVPLATEKAGPGLKGLTGDDSRVLIYWDGDYMAKSISEMARSALQSAEKRQGG